MNTTLVFALKLSSFFCETFAVIAWRYTTLAFAVKLCSFCCETFATMKNVAKKMLLFDVELISTSKKGFLANFNSKRLWLAKNWCTQLLAGKLEKLSLSWLALSTFCYFKLCWLVNRHHRYGWLGFLFLNCLARWQWRAGIFFPGTLNINQDWRGDTQLVLSVSYN